MTGPATGGEAKHSFIPGLGMLELLLVLLLVVLLVFGYWQTALELVLAVLAYVFGR